MIARNPAAISGAMVNRTLLTYAIGWHAFRRSWFRMSVAEIFDRFEVASVFRSSDPRLLHIATSCVESLKVTVHLRTISEPNRQCLKEL